MATKCLAALTLFLACACSPVPLPPATDSGVEGYVLMGPACPVMQVGVPCPDKPYAARLSILTDGALFKVGEVQADAAGYFRLALSPGRYVLRPESPGRMPHAGPISFAVQAHRFTRVDVAYDSGIR